ncbi:MAG: hypothetical protein WBX30_20090 [Stellaceae bacterium]
MKRLHIDTQARVEVAEEDAEPYCNQHLDQSFLNSDSEVPVVLRLEDLKSATCERRIKSFVQLNFL